MAIPPHPPASPRGPSVLPWVIAAVVAAIVAAVVLAAAGFVLWDLNRPSGPSDGGGAASGPGSEEAPDDPAEVEREDPRRAATRVIELMHTRDHATYEEDVEDASTLMTPDFAAEFRRTAEREKPEQLRQRSAVTADVQRAGVTGVDGDIAQVLVFFGTTTAAASETRTAEAALLTMVPDGDSWLLDEVASSGDQPRPEPDPARREVLQAAGELADAFLNVDYRNLEQTRTRVLRLSTGRFREQYEASFAELAALATSAQSVQTADTWASGVVTSSADSATVVLAASGEVTNTRADQPLTQEYRIQVKMRRVDGRWLTSDLRFVETPARSSDDATASL